MPGSAIHSIENAITSGRFVVIDGGTGTELERRGADMHSDVWCAMATLSNPETLRGVHEDYIRAGAKIITANTFSSSLNMLGPAGLADRFDEANRVAVEIALEARDRMNANETVAVAGSMSHQLPLIPGSGRRDPEKVPPAEVVASNHREMAAMLAGLGVDLIMLEMMSDPALANPAIAAAKSTGLPVWVGYSCRENGKGEPVSWTIDSLPIADMVRQIPPDRGDVAGVMHTSVSLISASIKAVRKLHPGPIAVYPDTGHFEMPSWVWTDAIAPADFGDMAVGWVEEGAQILGGCCGTGVEHIEALVEALARR